MTGPVPHADPQPPPIVLVTDDPVVRARIERLARDLGSTLLPFREPAAATPSGPARVVVIDLRCEGAIDAIASWKSARPDVPVAGVLTTPKPELWTQAEAAGADLVATHGTAARQIAGLLADPAAGRRRVRIGPLKDFEGRLGCVGVVADGDREIAVYRVGYDFCAVANACPHAGGRLSEGELDGPVVTCPRHGSRFDVRTGQRVRGPADDPIAVYRVVVEDGAVFIQLG